MIAQTAKNHQKTAVRYNRKTKTWEAINGSVTRCADKNEALMVALRNDHPALYHRVTHIAAIHNNEPAVVDRLFNAAALVAKRHVNGQSVTGQTSDRTYRVTFAGRPKRWTCNCPDFVTGGIDTDYGRMCKHALAALLNYLVNGTHPTPTTL